MHHEVEQYVVVSMQGYGHAGSGAMQPHAALAASS